nr:GAF domain-containing protein [uncultured Dethiosulfovibrio sp.]
MSKEILRIKAETPAQLYNYVNGKLTGLICEEPDPLANLANAAALLYLLLDDLNWAGFYLMRESENALVLGPFQGKPACTRIPLDKGVCGAAARTGEIQIVSDVHLFPGHIACDGASASEIVIPLIREDRVLGVLDLDSPTKGRFSAEDGQGLSSFVETLHRYVAWDELFAGR